MTEHINDFKGKSKRRGRSSSLDFVVPLQMEECIYRIEQLPQESESADIRFDVWYPEWEDSDTYAAEFQIYLSEAGKAVGTASGKMQRWEGTSTRFTGQFDSDEGINTKALKQWMVYWLPINTLTCALCSLSVLISPEYTLKLITIALTSYLIASAITLNMVGQAHQRARLDRLKHHIKTLITGTG